MVWGSACAGCELFMSDGGLGHAISRWGVYPKPTCLLYGPLDCNPTLFSYTHKALERRIKIMYKFWYLFFVKRLVERMLGAEGFLPPGFSLLLQKMALKLEVRGEGQPSPFSSHVLSEHVSSGWGHWGNIGEELTTQHTLLMRCALCMRVLFACMFVCAFVHVCTEVGGSVIQFECVFRQQRALGHLWCACDSCTCPKACSIDHIKVVDLVQGSYPCFHMFIDNMGKKPFLFKLLFVLESISTSKEHPTAPEMVQSWARKA